MGWNNFCIKADYAKSYKGELSFFIVAYSLFLLP